VNAIVYLVDCNDRDRFPEAKSELDKLLQNDQLQGVPFLILGNKIDMQRAASEPELRQALGLQHYLTGKVSTHECLCSLWKIFDFHSCLPLARSCPNILMLFQG
jgi:GTPase SAR1 family protein